MKLVLEKEELKEIKVTFNKMTSLMNVLEVISNDEIEQIDTFIKEMKSNSIVRYSFKEHAFTIEINPDFTLIILKDYRDTVLKLIPLIVNIIPSVKAIVCKLKDFNTNIEGTVKTFMNLDEIEEGEIC